MTDNKFTILAVDDDPINLGVLQEYIEDRGYGIICCDNGIEALTVLASQSNKIDASRQSV